MDNYEIRVQKYSKEELIDILMNLDKEKYPDRYQIVKRRYEEIKDNPTFSRVDPLDRYHTGMRRFWAMILDGILIQVLAIVLFLSFGTLVGATESDQFEFYIHPVYAVWLTAVFGKTFGKHVCNVKVVSYPDENKIGIRHALMREIFPIALVAISLPLGLIIGQIGNEVPMAFNLGIAILLGGGTLGWFILEIVTMLRDPKRRAFHDKIAKTVVVKA